MEKTQDTASQDTASAQEKLSVKVFSPFHVYYEGEAYSVSAVNKTGPFDVLPGHANFFSLLFPGEFRVDTCEEKISFNIKQSIMLVAHNQVTVFVSA